MARLLKLSGSSILESWICLLCIFGCDKPCPMFPWPQLKPGRCQLVTMRLCPISSHKSRGCSSSRCLNCTYPVARHSQSKPPSKAAVREKPMTFPSLNGVSSWIIVARLSHCHPRHSPFHSIVAESKDPALTPCQVLQLLRIKSKRRPEIQRY